MSKCISTVGVTVAKYVNSTNYYKVRPVINTNTDKFNNNYNIVNYIISYLVFAYFMPTLLISSTTTNHKMVGITYAYILISIALYSQH